MYASPFSPSLIGNCYQKIYVPHSTDTLLIRSGFAQSVQRSDHDQDRNQKGIWQGRVVTVPFRSDDVDGALMTL